MSGPSPEGNDIQLSISRSGFSRPVIVITTSVVVLSFLAALLLMAYHDPVEVVSHEPSSFSQGAIGHQALVEFLEASGVQVLRSRYATLGKFGSGRTLLLLEPVDLERLARFVEASRKTKTPLLVVLPKWKGVPDPLRSGWVAHVELVSELRILKVLEACGIHGGAVRGILRGRSEAEVRVIRIERGREHSVELQQGQFLTGLSPTFKVVASGEEGAFVVRDHRSSVYVLTDPDLVNNHGLGQAENAAFLLDLIRSIGHPKVVIDETIHGFIHKPMFLQELLRFPLGFLVLHGALFLGIVVWGLGTRFGKPLPVPPPLGTGKEVLIDNTAGLLSCSGQTADCLDRYLQQTIRFVAEYHALGSERSEERLIRQLDSLADVRGVGEKLHDIREGVESFRSRRRRASNPLAFAARIYTWRKEMTNGS